MLATNRGRLVGTALAAVAIAGGILLACGGDSSDAPPAPGGEGGAPPTTPPGTPPGPPGGDGGVPPSTGSYVAAPPGTGAALCNDTYGAVVAWLEPCCTAADKATNDYLFADGLLRCVSQACSSDLEDSIGKGRVLYDPALLAQCKQQIDALLASAQCGGAAPTAGATNPLADGGACTTAFQGGVASGQPCLQPYECAPGTACVGYAAPASDAGTAKEGTCVPLPALDAGCGQGKIDGGAITFNFFFGS